MRTPTGHTQTRPGGGFRFDLEPGEYTIVTEGLHISHWIRVFPGIVSDCRIDGYYPAPPNPETEPPGPEDLMVPHEVVVCFESGSSVERKAAAVEEILSAYPGTRNLSASSKPVIRNRVIGLSETLSVDIAIDAFRSIDGVTRVRPKYLKPGSYAPGEPVLGFEESVTKSGRDGIVSAVHGAIIKREYTFISSVYIKLPDGMTVVDAMRIYAYLPGIRYVEANGISRID